MAPPAATLTSIAHEKTLQQKFVRDEDERPKVAYNEFSNEIPIISLAGIDEVEGRRADICKKIVEACEDWGIFQIVDHGVDAELISEMTGLAREFFDLPSEEKLRFDMSGGKKGGFIVSSHLQVITTLYIRILIGIRNIRIFVHQNKICWLIVIFKNKLLERINWLLVW